MKQPVLVLLGIYVGYLEFADDLKFWLPAFGSIDNGQAVWQFAILGLLALAVFGTAVWLSYDMLTWILE